MYNRSIKLLFVGIVLLQLTGCIFKNNQPKAVVVNVLDKGAYEDCHIKGSINVDYDKLKEYAQRHWNKDTTCVVVYCSNFRCSASLEAAKVLVNELGFNKNNIFAYEGGSALARHEGIDMQGACKESYLNDIEEKQSLITSKEGINIINTAQLKAFLKQYALQ